MRRADSLRESALPRKRPTGVLGRMSRWATFELMQCRKEILTRSPRRRGQATEAKLREAQYPRGLRLIDNLEFRGLQTTGSSAGLGALEDVAAINADLTIGVSNVRAIADQSAASAITRVPHRLRGWRSVPPIVRVVLLREFRNGLCSTKTPSRCSRAITANATSMSWLCCLENVRAACRWSGRLSCKS